MNDPWGVDQAPAFEQGSARSTDLIEGWEEAELPEVQRLVEVGWELLDDAPLFALLPAAWPTQFRAWVPNRLVRYADHVNGQGQVESYSPVGPDDSSRIELEDDIDRYGRRAGLPPMPRNRIWLVKSPWPDLTVEEVYEAVEEVSNVGGTRDGDFQLDAVYLAMLELRQWSSEQVKAVIKP